MFYKIINECISCNVADVFLLKEYSNGKWVLKGHSKGTRTWVLGHSRHLGTRGTRVLGYSITWGTRALKGSLDTQALSHLVTWDTRGRFCMTIIYSAWLRKTQFDAVGMILSYDFKTRVCFSHPNVLGKSTLIPPNFLESSYPLDTGCKLKKQSTFRRRPRQKRVANHRSSQPVLSLEKSLFEVSCKILQKTPIIESFCAIGDFHYTLVFF